MSIKYNNILYIKVFISREIYINTTKFRWPYNIVFENKKLSITGF